MSRYFLSSAAIEGFRGINNDGDPLVLRFKHDAVNSIHAPNGVGKSSVFEALHFALHGTVPRLEGMQDAEQGRSYIINKFHPGQQATVALIFKSDDGTPDVSITVTRTAAGGRVVTSPSGHADPDSLHALLTDALAVVKSADWHDPKVCPVCEKAGDGPLQDQLEAKIALYDEAEQLDAELKRQVQSAGCVGKLRQLEDHARLGVPDADRIATVLTLAARQSSVSTADLECAKDRLGALEAKRIEVLEAVNVEIVTLQANLPPSLVAVTRTLGQAKQFRDAMKDYETSLPALAAKRAKLAKLSRWKTFITNVAQQFATAEGALAHARITDIQASCQDLFGNLVRGGPDVRPTLNRAPNTEQVDLMLADFFGLHDQSARALLSESYRNAVAASIFMAAATRHQGVPRFMVLDDVTSSFDAGHQFSLMDTIRTKLRFGAPNGLPGGLQFIILSHDTILEKYFDRLGNTAEWHHQKLQGMPPRGRLMIAAQQADRLKAQAEQYLNAGQIDIGEPIVRQYLEYKLGQIISRLEILVPPDYATRGDKRTLSTYMDAITGAVTLFQAANRCVLSAQQITDLHNHHAPSIMANYVSHYESGAGNPFNAYALLGVLQSIDALADCFCWTDPATNQRKYYRRLDRQ